MYEYSGDVANIRHAHRSFSRPNYCHSNAKVTLAKNYTDTERWYDSTQVETELSASKKVFIIMIRLLYE